MGGTVLTLKVHAKVDLVGGEQYGFSDQVATRLAQAIDELGLALYVAEVWEEDELLYQWEKAQKEKSNEEG